MKDTILTHSDDVRVPSFCVKKRGQVSPRRRMARWKPEMVRRAKARIDALSIEAFSRSNRPTFPTAETDMTV